MAQTKEEKAAYQKAYYAANKEKSKAATKAWREANEEKFKAAMKAWREANEDRIREYRKMYYKATNSHRTPRGDTLPPAEKKVRRHAAAKAYRGAKRVQIVTKRQEHRDTASRSYVARTLQIPVAELPPDLFEAKRLHLLIKRKLKDLK